MEKEITMRLDKGREEYTILGWKTLTIIDFGYDSEGVIQTALAIGEGSTCPHTSHLFDPKGTLHVNNPNDPNSKTCDGGPTGTYGLFTITEPELSEDLLINYSVVKGE